MLYTEEAIEAIDEALAAEELEDDAAAQAEADITPPGPVGDDDDGALPS